eukprot:MONOS_16132.1-p1 / transcript=MONOS_16132.1 / gene=MONOS_16132 / organism=Monocercomonoides_exilis_PA203 / gene_product=unspecified product / transcript_product=unspecified product / location=Mono_scaffold01519:6045-7100(+) / protein_length=331 / sequence_SO=supercontig / SO=protein_coding / is_pseudo=false
MIIEEEKKKEEKNEKLLVDLCECYALLGENDIFSEVLSIIVPCLLKVASKKEGNEETQKEVEMALPALSNVNAYYEMKRDLYLNEIKETMKYHQEHRNLTQLSYQSAWQFLYNRNFFFNELESVIVNELHCAREAARELEELSRNVDWKKKGGEKMNKEETKKEVILTRWIETFSIYFRDCRLRNEEYICLLSRIVQIYRAAKGNNGVISILCIQSLRTASDYGVVKVEDLLKSGAIDAVLEELNRPTLNEDMTNGCLQFFTNVSERLNEKNKDEKEEEERKVAKMEMFEKLEEEGFEDIITGFHETFEFFQRNYDCGLSLNAEDYFVNA